MIHRITIGKDSFFHSKCFPTKRLSLKSVSVALVSKPSFTDFLFIKFFKKKSLCYQSQSDSGDFTKDESHRLGNNFSTLTGNFFFIFTSAFWLTKKRFLLFFVLWQLFSHSCTFLVFFRTLILCHLIETFLLARLEIEL